MTRKSISLMTKNTPPYFGTFLFISFRVYLYYKRLPYPEKFMILCDPTYGHETRDACGSNMAESVDINALENALNRITDLERIATIPSQGTTGLQCCHKITN